MLLYLLFIGLGLTALLTGSFAISIVKTSIRLGPAPHGVGLRDTTWRATGLTIGTVCAICSIASFVGATYLVFGGL